VRISVPRDLWSARTVFDPRSQVGWDALPAGRTSIDWGTTWAAGGKTVLAEVPSVIVPEEANLLINPRLAGDHLKAVKVRRWSYDFRFAQRMPRR
jgi:hypothetical protein